MTSSEKKPRFVWPPNPLAQESADGPASEPRNAEADSSPRVRPGFWNALESTLLGGGGGGALLDDWAAGPLSSVCPRCGDTVGSGETDELGCGSCRKTRLAWNHAIRMGRYEGVLRAAITACKYRNDRRAGRAVGARLAECVADRFRGERIDTDAVLLVPVPTTTRRRFSNAGLDHTLLLANEIGRVMGVRPRRLLERRHTPHQAGLSAAARARNVAGTIRVRHRLGVPRPGHVVLVDDVRTTGATASACFRAIKSRFGPSWDMTGGRDACLPRFWLVTAAVSSRRRATGEMPPHDAGPGAESEKTTDNLHDGA